MSGLFARVLPSKISASDAEAIARAECERREWPWEEPVEVRRRARTYRIWTNTEFRGGNVEIVVDASTGEVRRAWLNPQ